MMDVIELAIKASRGEVIDEVLGDFDAELPMQDVRRFLDEIITNVKPSAGFDTLCRSGALSVWLPELVSLRELGDGERMHKDVWAHTMAVVEGVPAELDVRWGALFHDIGKPATRRFGKKNTVTFHNHDIVGAKIFDKINARTGMFKSDPTLSRTIRHLIEEHLRPAAYDRSWSDSAVRRLLTECGSSTFFERLMLLSRADLTTKNDAKRKRCVARANELEDRIMKIKEFDERPRLPKGVMGKIIERSNLSPGPWANEVRQQLETWLSNGRIPVDAPEEALITFGLGIIVVKDKMKGK